MNSFYGVLGGPSCQFFMPAWQFITRRGRARDTAAQEPDRAAGHQVICSDTDSVFVWIHEADSDAQAVAAGRQLPEPTWIAGGAPHGARRVSAGEACWAGIRDPLKRCLMPTVRGSDKGSKALCGDRRRPAG